MQSVKNHVWLRLFILFQLTNYEKDRTTVLFFYAEKLQQMKESYMMTYRKHINSIKYSDKNDYLIFNQDSDKVKVA